MNLKKSMKVKKFLCATLGCSLMTNAYAVIYGGIDFPQGISSFADKVIKYDPLFNRGPAPSTNFQDTNKALGAPDYVSNSGYVSLGRGGLIELLFTNNILSNSGNNGKTDLHIFEVGPDVEDTFVAIRPTASTLPLLDPSKDANKDGFFEVGKIFGSTSSIDIDAIFPGFAAGKLLFDAVQLIDDPNEGNRSGVTVGADIDSVGAISSLVSYDIVQTIGIADLNGNNIPEEATLVKNNFNKYIQVLIRDSKTKALLKTINFTTTGNYTPLGLTEVPDLNSNGNLEIAILYRNDSTKENGYIMRDSWSSVLIKSFVVGIVQAKSITVLSDTDGNSLPEVAITSLVSSTGTYQLIIRDALTGSLVRAIPLP